MLRLTRGQLQALGILTAAACLALATGRASAWNLESNGAGDTCSWPTMRAGNPFGWTNDATGNGRTDFFDSKDDWNAKGTRVDLSGSGQGIVTNNPYYGYDNDTDGITYWTCNGAGNFTGTTSVNLNSYFGARYTDDERRSVTTHEFGHSFGLAHYYNSNCAFDGIMDPTTYGRFTVCMHFRPQEDDVQGITVLLGYPSAAATQMTPGMTDGTAAPGTTPFGAEPTTAATDAAGVTRGIEIDYATSYSSLAQLRKDADFVAVVKPTGSVTLVSTPDGSQDTLATVSLIRSVSGAQLPATFDIHEVGSTKLENSILMEPGRAYLVYLRAGTPTVTRQYDLVGGSQALFADVSSSVPATTDRAFVPVDPGAAQRMPAAVSISDAQSTG